MASEPMAGFTKAECSLSGTKIRVKEGDPQEVAAQITSHEEMQRLADEGVIEIVEDLGILDERTVKGEEEVGRLRRFLGLGGN